MITLAAAFALPLTVDGGEPLPGRELLLLCAYLVVLVTLVGQGLTFGPLLRLLGLRDDRAGRLRARGEARVAATEAALRQLDDMAEDGFDADVRAAGAGTPSGGCAGARSGSGCWTGPTPTRTTAYRRRRR